ncbi:MAG: flagellar export chaperone FlgN [Mariprofundus sp.]
MISTEMKTLFASLDGLFGQMNAIAENLELVIKQERDAVRRIDGDSLVELCERRAQCHQLLTGLEQECWALLKTSGVPEEMTIEAFIELYAGADAMYFQALRRNLYERMAHIERDNAENYIRLHAAFDVTSSVLQQIGVEKSSQTYEPGSVR